VRKPDVERAGEGDPHRPRGYSLPRAGVTDVTVMRWGFAAASGTGRSAENETETAAQIANAKSVAAIIHHVVLASTMPSSILRAAERKCTMPLQN